MRVSIGDKQDRPRGSLPPRSLIDNLANNQLIELVTVTSTRIFAIFNEINNRFLVIRRHKALVGIPKLIGILHIAVITKGHNAKPQVVIVFE